MLNDSWSQQRKRNNKKKKNPIQKTIIAFHVRRTHSPNTTSFNFWITFQIRLIHWFFFYFIHLLCVFAALFYIALFWIIPTCDAFGLSRFAWYSHRMEASLNSCFIGFFLIPIRSVLKKRDQNDDVNVELLLLN